MMMTFRPSASLIRVALPGVVIAFQKCVGAGAGATKSALSEDGGAVQHIDLLAIRLQTIVGAPPDAFLLAYFALSLAGAAARAITLIFRALRFRAQIGDIRQRAVAAIPA